MQDINTMIRELVPSDTIKEFRLSLDYDNVTDKVNRGSLQKLIEATPPLNIPTSKNRGMT